MRELFAVLAHEALLDAWPYTSSDFDKRFRGKTGSPQIERGYECRRDAGLLPAQQQLIM
jgi:hypothetical protein